MNEVNKSAILVISSYPPRECGIATYTQDLVRSLAGKFSRSFDFTICALESETENHHYENQVQYILNTSNPESYLLLAKSVNAEEQIKLILIEHEFGFYSKRENHLLNLIAELRQPVIITFHTVLPAPDPVLKEHVQNIAESVAFITVMTQNASEILQQDYNISAGKIAVIAHGVHLVPFADKELLKVKHGFTGRKILSTFGLISSGKSIETTLDALPAIVAAEPDILFLAIGKTHPGVIKQEGEKYRKMLEAKVKELHLTKHVLFINQYLPLVELLEYLQLTDVYLFTSKDPNQAVSGTFSYAISCGCPVISTPIPHAREVLQNDSGILIDFENSVQLSKAVLRLLNDETLRSNISSGALHKIVPSAWENIAIAHASLFEETIKSKFELHYNLPPVKLDHIRNLTTPFGMIQFSKINLPDISSGFTLDDNARAMIAMCMHYESTGDIADLALIQRYLLFIEYCIQPNGRFLNYVNSENQFHSQNDENNLDDANGRAIWALGYLISHKNILPEEFISASEYLLHRALVHIYGTHSSRAIAFALKGLFYYNEIKPDQDNIFLAEKLANRLERMYRHESESGWNWFESYLTYGNSILPEGMLCAYLITGNEEYKSIAKESFDFLLAKTFTETKIKLISNRSWLLKGASNSEFGEQPIDVAYTILALGRFADVFENKTYIDQMRIAFSWFLGNNHLGQIIYNPGTGGCYDGLEENHINLNQGAESTVSYLLSRMTVEKYLHKTYHTFREEVLTLKTQ